MSAEAQSTEGFELNYGLDDVPKPFPKAVGLGLQHILTMFGATILVPIIVAGPLGLTGPGDLAILISSVFIASGIATALQVTIGTRLPIIQGVSFAFLAPIFAIAAQYQGAEAMRYIAGMIIAGAVVEVLVGYGGLMGLLRRYITPVTIAPVIATVSPLHQRTFTPRVVTRRDIEQHQMTVLEMPLGKLVLDPNLPLKQPIHGGVKLMNIDLAEVQFFPQGMLGRLWLQGRCCTQFRAWREYSGDNHRHDQIPLTASPRSQQILQPELPSRLQYGHHIAMRQTPDDFERGERGVFIEFAAQTPLHEINHIGRQSGEICDRLMLDLAILAITVSEQDRGIVLPFDRFSDRFDAIFPVFGAHAPRCTATRRG
jgi:hypothetical protein